MKQARSVCARIGGMGGGEGGGVPRVPKLRAAMRAVLMVRPNMLMIDNELIVWIQVCRWMDVGLAWYVATRERSLSVASSPSFRQREPTHLGCFPERGLEVGYVKTYVVVSMNVVERMWGAEKGIGKGKNKSLVWDGGDVYIVVGGGGPLDSIMSTLSIVCS